MMQGGLHPDLDITYFEDLFRSIKERFPTITIHSLSAPEIVHIAKVSGLTVAETLRRLKAAGLDSLPGGGAEILVDRVRKQVAPGKADTRTWLEVMREAHRQGIPGHGDHDVRQRRDPGGPGGAPARHPRAAGRDRRLPGLHPLELPVGAHRSGDPPSQRRPAWTT